MDFSKALKDLLFQHECVVIPGFGGFLVKQENAQFKPEHNRFYPPAGTIYFNSELKANDGLIANYIANERNISFREATDTIENNVAEIRNIIQSKGSFILHGIGAFSLHHEGNLEFTPDDNANFLSSSYGLPVFSPHQVTYNEFDPQLVNLRPERKTGHLVAETLKWAAVLLPFAFAATWGALNLNTITNVVQSEAALFPWTFSTPGKSTSAVVQPKQNITENASEAISVSRFENRSNASITAFAAYTTLHGNPPEKSITHAQALANEAGYYIIGGAFKDYKNALRLTEQMKSLGYDSGMLGMNAKGLYVVYIQSCQSQTEALVQLTNIRRAVQPKAWLLKNN